MTCHGIVDYGDQPSDLSLFLRGNVKEQPQKSDRLLVVSDFQNFSLGQYFSSYWSLCTVHQCSVLLSPYILVLIPNTPTKQGHLGRKRFIHLEKVSVQNVFTCSNPVLSYALLSFCYQLYSSYRYLSLVCPNLIACIA